MVDGGSRNPWAFFLRLQCMGGARGYAGRRGWTPRLDGLLQLGRVDAGEPKHALTDVAVLQERLLIRPMTFGSLQDALSYAHMFAGTVKGSALPSAGHYSVCLLPKHAWLPTATENNAASHGSHA